MRPFRLAAGAAALWGAAYYLGRAWGSTPEERRRRLPGDDIVPDVQVGGDHAITIDAAPADIWPWLLQMGWHRGGWYTYRWVDTLLFPHNAPSADAILPEYQDLKLGDVVPDGTPESGCFFVVREIETASHLVLHSTTHLPPQLLHKEGVRLSWTWTFVLRPRVDGTTRFHFRWRAAVRPWWLRLGGGLLIPPADFVMARGMCNGLKRRVEARSGPAS